MSIVHELPGKLKVEWDPSARAIIDHWTNLALTTLAEFQTAIMEKGLKHAAANQGHAYIVDNSGAKGAFSQEIQAYIGAEVFPAFARNKIKYFITIPSAESSLTNMAAKKYQAKVGPNGIQLVEVPSVAEALRWLAEHAH